MSTFKLPQTAFALALIAAALPMANARAADLDPGYADVPAPITQQMVTFGSGWYVRGDIAATENYKVDLARPSRFEQSIDASRTHNAGYDLSLGGGYAFTNSVRGDITVDFHQPVSTALSGQECVTLKGQKKFTCSVNGRFDHYDALANGYYDFGPWSIVTPYVGAGVGMGFGKMEADLYNDPNGPYAARATYHSFAWALMAGVAIDVYAHTKLDIGYRYLDNGNVQGTHIFYHEIRAGLRYMIDN